MDEKKFNFWIDKKNIILLPYLGLRWDYGFEICVMWLFFNLSLYIEKNKK